MNRNLLVTLVAAALFVGCASPYKVTLTNGTVLTTASKPKLDTATNSYFYKDAQGKTITIPAMRIRQIEPVSGSGKSEKFRYN